MTVSPTAMLRAHMTYYLRHCTLKKSHTRGDGDRERPQAPASGDLPRPGAASTVGSAYSHQRYCHSAAPPSTCTRCFNRDQTGGVSRMAVGRRRLAARARRPRAARPSRRRDCHFYISTLSFPIKTPAKGRGRCSRMTELSPTASSAPASSCMVASSASSAHS